MEEDFIKGLNEQQRDAVLYTDGPALVIAGAGSGKTRVLTYKIVHLLRLGYEPWRILALTFTNKAAREMRERIEGLVGAHTASRLWMGTFHSIFARILRSNAERIGYKSNFTIYDTADSKALIKTIIKDMDLDDKIYKASTVQSAISTAKNALISPQQYAQARDIMEADRRCHRPRTAEIYRTYCNRCFVAGAMDFDDLLYYTNVLLRDNPDILHHYQEFFRYVLVDEYQDTNFAQHLIVSQLCQETHKLCVVGDDAQSIYSFRGANIRNILNLRNAYPDLRIFKLEQNYRSTQNIINAANSLIDKNTEQIRKKVFSRNEQGSRIEVVQSFSDFEESYLVANRIASLKMQQHDNFEEYAILYRTNAQSRILEESLRKRNIPYRIYGGLSFYQRKEVKDAIAYFRLSVNPDDDEALKRVINYPSRGIGETTMNKLIRAAIDNRVSIWTVINNIASYDTGINAGITRKLLGFRDMIKSFIAMNQDGADAAAVANRVITETQMLPIQTTDTTPENISQQENLGELLNGVNEFVASKIEEGNENIGLSDFLGEVSLATDQDIQDGDTTERVTLMTVHAAKGLEFNNIFVVGVEEGLFPYYFISNDGDHITMHKPSARDVEEERRLLYVALTRAKTFCMITYASSRFRNGQTQICSPSRFIRDIDPQYLALTSGTDLGRRTTVINPIANYRDSYHTPMRPAASTPSPAPRLTPPSRLTSVQAATSHAQSTGTEGQHTAAELSEGMAIAHSRFGNGVITNIDTSNADARITVEFQNVGSKTLLLKFAKFNIVDQ